MQHNWLYCGAQETFASGSCWTMRDSFVCPGVYCNHLLDYAQVVNKAEQYCLAQFFNFCCLDNIHNLSTQHNTWETNLFKFDSPGELFLFCFEHQTYFPQNSLSHKDPDFMFIHLFLLPWVQPWGRSMRAQCWTVQVNTCKVHRGVLVSCPKDSFQVPGFRV
jgi:hypothetical protein